MALGSLASYWEFLEIIVNGLFWPYECQGLGTCRLEWRDRWITFIHNKSVGVEMKKSTLWGQQEDGFQRLSVSELMPSAPFVCQGSFFRWRLCGGTHCSNQI